MRRCFSAYAAKCCAVLWLNHEGSKSGANKLVTKDNAASLWTPYREFHTRKKGSFGVVQITALIAFRGLSFSLSITTLIRS